MDVLMQAASSSASLASSVMVFPAGSQLPSGYGCDCNVGVSRELHGRSRALGLPNSARSISTPMAVTVPREKGIVPGAAAKMSRRGKSRLSSGRRRRRGGNSEEEIGRGKRDVVVLEEGGGLLGSGKGSGKGWLMMANEMEGGLLAERGYRRALGNNWGCLPSRGLVAFRTLAGLGGVNGQGGGCEGREGEDEGWEAGVGRTDNDEEEAEVDLPSLEVGRGRGFALLPWNDRQSTFTNCKAITRRGDGTEETLFSVAEGFGSAINQAAQIEVGNAGLASSAQIVGWTTGSGMTGPISPSLTHEGVADEACVMKKDDAVGLVMQAALGTGWTTGSGMSGPDTSMRFRGEDASPSGESDNWTPWVGLSTSPRRRMRVKFTCNLCGERTTRAINPHAYTEGTVFAQCQRCGIFHKLADNLNLFNDLKGPDFGKYEGVVKKKPSLFRRDSPYTAFNSWLRVDDLPMP